MKRTIHFIFLLSLTLIGKNGISQIENQSEKPTFLAKRDSVILEKEFGSIYITKDTSSIIYSWIKSNYENIEKSYLKGSIKEIVKHSNIQLKHFMLSDLHKEWSPIKIFNNQLTLYCPTDWMNNYTFIITDSAIYNSSSDATVQVITNYTKTNNLHTFNLLDYHGNKTKLTIEETNDSLGVSIWIIFNNQGDIISKSLKVKSTKVKKFPFLVFDCYYSKCDFASPNDYFQKINFNAIKNVR